MASRPPDAEPAAARAAVDDPLPDGAPGSVARRAPFSDNPQVGARGQQTQQRILEAALEVFGAEGYERCSVDRITTVAGCSRASFYQYFSGKPDVFRHLAGQLARQLSASIEALAPLTGDAAGRDALRRWIDRYAEIYERYAPVFRAAQAAVESDEAVAGGFARAGGRVVAGFRSRVAGTLPPRLLDPVIGLVLESLARAFADLSIVQLAEPSAVSSERFRDAVADVVHRTFFGLRPEANVHPPTGDAAPLLPFSPMLWRALQDDVRSDADGSATVRSLMEAGRDVFVARGYHGTRIDDVVERAGLSHGAFYRYFDSKDEFVRIVAIRAMRTVSTAFLEIPGARALASRNGGAALRRWLRRYNTTQAAEAAVIRVWADATLADPTLRADSAAVLDWGRRRMADFLRPRGFGDVDTEAMVLVAVLGAFGTSERSTPSLDAAAHLIERGLLGR